MSTPKTAIYTLCDDEGAGEVAVVRCADGDRAEFDRLVSGWLGNLRDTYDLDEMAVVDPVWRLYRKNPCNDGEHGWDLGRPTRPGPGTWMGALVVLKRQAAEVSS